MAGLNIPWLDTGWYNTGNSMLPGGHVRYDPMSLWYANIGDAAANYARNYNAANVMKNIYRRASGITNRQNEQAINRAEEYAQQARINSNKLISRGENLLTNVMNFNKGLIGTAQNISDKAWKDMLGVGSSGYKAIMQLLNQRESAKPNVMGFSDITSAVTGDLFSKFAGKFGVSHGAVKTPTQRRMTIAASNAALKLGINAATITNRTLAALYDSQNRLYSSAINTLGGLSSSLIRGRMGLAGYTIGTVDTNIRANAQLASTLMGLYERGMINESQLANSLIGIQSNIINSNNALSLAFLNNAANLENTRLAGTFNTFSNYMSGVASMRNASRRAMATTIASANTAVGQSVAARQRANARRYAADVSARTAANAQAASQSEAQANRDWMEYMYNTYGLTPKGMATSQQQASQPAAGAYNPDAVLSGAAGGWTQQSWEAFRQSGYSGALLPPGTGYDYNTGRIYQPGVGWVNPSELESNTPWWKSLYNRLTGNKSK